MDVEMRHLRALLALADELNFTRAAEKLHLTQQALSGQIRQLEERVGTRLVERDSRHVALTRPGTILCEQARPLLAGAEHAIASARAAGDGRSRLTIGYIAPLLTRRLVAPALEQFSAEHPDVEVSIQFANFLDPLGGLRDGDADVAILYGEFEHDGIELRRLFSEPRGVALAADHPLAAKSTVPLDDVLRQPLVEVPVRDRLWHQFWTADEHRRTAPGVGARVQTLDGLFEAVGAGLGVALSVAPAVEAFGSSAGVVFRPVPGLAPLEFWVAHHEGDHRPQVQAFIEAAVATPAFTGAS